MKQKVGEFSMHNEKAGQYFCDICEHTMSQKPVHSNGIDICDDCLYVAVRVLQRTLQEVKSNHSTGITAIPGIMKFHE